jgi:hypothetical protein
MERSTLNKLYGQAREKIKTMVTSDENVDGIKM